MHPFLSIIICLHTVIYQVFQSNTNNLNTTEISSNYSYLKIICTYKYLKPYNYVKKILESNSYLKPNCLQIIGVSYMVSSIPNTNKLQVIIGFQVTNNNLKYTIIVSTILNTNNLVI